MKSNSIQNIEEKKYPPLISSFGTPDYWLRAWVKFRLEEPAENYTVYTINGEKCLGLYATLGFDCAMTQEGQILISDEIGEESVWRIASSEERMWVIVGAQRKRFPEFMALLPLRPETAVDCVECNGTGFVYKEIALCTACSSLGWFRGAET